MSPALPSALGTPSFGPVQGARLPDAQPGVSPPTRSATQVSLTPASAPLAMADVATPTRGTLVIATDSQRSELDAGTDWSQAGKDLAMKFGPKVLKLVKSAAEWTLGTGFLQVLDTAKDIGKLGREKGQELAKAIDKYGTKKTLDKYGLKGEAGIKELKVPGLKSGKSGLGGLLAVGSAIYDLKASFNSRAQAALHAKGAAKFEQQSVNLTSQLKQGGDAGARAALYGIDAGTRAGAADTAQAWLKHNEASSKSNVLGAGLALGATGLHAAADVGVTISYEVAKAAGEYGLKEAMTKALPFVGIAGASIGLATSTHALVKQNDVRKELNNQREQLAAVTAQNQGAVGGVGMDGALANVFKASQVKLEIRTTANHIEMASSGLAIAGNATALAGNVAAVTGVGVVASAALTVTSMAFSLMSICASIGAAVYSKRMNSADAVEKGAITPGKLEERFEGLGGADLDAAKAKLAGENKFYALVYLAETLQTAELGSPAFKNAEQMLGQVMGDEKARAIITLARANPGAIDINSAAVNELGKALYGAPVGEVTAKPAAAVEAAEGGEVAAYDLPETPDARPAISRVPTTVDLRSQFV